MKIASQTLPPGFPSVERGEWAGSVSALDPIDSFDFSTQELEAAAPELRQALTTFQQAKARPYYDEPADKKSIEKYYKDFDRGSTGKTFFKALHKLLKDSHTEELPYEPSLYLYPWVDLRPNLKLQSLYSSKAMNAAEAILEDYDKAKYWNNKGQTAALTAIAPETAAAQMAITDAHGFLNCEHVVCQSWFDYKEPMKGDLHHLFSCDPGCNSFRNTRPLAEIADEDRDAKMKACGTLSEGGELFEPEAGKGASARATLYFLVRYPKKISQYSKEDLQTLLEWNRQDPPSLYEKHRNQAIHELQGNRNPFIDFPEWADELDFSLGVKSQRRD